MLIIDNDGALFCLLWRGTEDLSGAYLLIVTWINSVPENMHTLWIISAYNAIKQFDDSTVDGRGLKTVGT